MSTTELLTALRQRGIKIEADGERLRFYPREAVTAGLLAVAPSLRDAVENSQRLTDLEHKFNASSE